MNLNVFVCVEEIPFIRDIQHRFYLIILTIMNNELPSLIMDCLEGSEDKKIQAAHSILDIRKTIDSLTGEAHSAILQEFYKKTEILSGIEMNNVILLRFVNFVEWGTFFINSANHSNLIHFFILLSCLLF